jgi:thioredoxin:protein disulfide reductase
MRSSSPLRSPTAAKPSTRISPLPRAITCTRPLLGAIQIVGAASGGRDVLRPLQPLASRRDVIKAGSLPWRPVRDIDQLDAALANANGKPIVLDFTADWCVSCTEMERFTFSDPRVAARLAGMQLLSVDVTLNGKHVTD